MTQEEKAKAYDKALEIAKAWCKLDNNDLCNDDLETLFPELKESEDEKIRKDVLAFIRREGQHIDKYKWHKWITWLEKQGEKQKKVSIWKHWKDGIAGNGEGKQIYLTKTGNIYDISSCLGCECDYIELSELDSLLRDKQASKQKWTEEDERHYATIIKALHSSGAITPIDMELAEKWFKSLKKMMEEQQ